MSSKMLPQTTTALISVSTSTVSPKTLTSISNKLIFQQSSRKLIVDLPLNKTVEEKSISKPGGLVYRSSRRIAGFLFNKPNSELSPAHDQPTCTLDNFERFRRIPGMIAIFGKDPDTCPFIDVAVCGGKVEDQIARVILKLSVGGMRDHGRFRQVTLRVRFTDDKDVDIDIPYFRPEDKISVNPALMTKNTGTTVNGGITLGWQGTGINFGGSRHSDDTISTEAYDMTAKGVYDPEWKHGVRWELEEGEKCKLDTYTCEVRFKMPSEVNAHFRLHSCFTTRIFEKVYKVPAQVKLNIE